MDSDFKNKQGASNRDWGAHAESLAAEYLIKQGYTIRERNFKLAHIEIDIIAEKENEIVFVEVKARTGEHQDPLNAVDKRKRNKMINGADIYLRDLPSLYYYRFDIITFTGTEDNYTMEHYPDAFMPPLKRRIH